MLASEVEAAAPWWLGALGFPLAVRQVVRSEGRGWDGPGLVTVTDEHLRFEGADGERTTSVRTVESVHLHGPTVWVRRRRAHGWAVRCRSEEDARELAASIRNAAGL